MYNYLVLLPNKYVSIFIFTQVGFTITPHESTILFEVLQFGLEKYLDDLNQISSQASKEYALEKALNKMKTDWEYACFSFSTYKDGNSYVLAAVDEIQVTTFINMLSYPVACNAYMRQIFLHYAKKIDYAYN